MALRLLIVFLFLCPSHVVGGVSEACSENETANEIAAGHNLTGKVAIVTGGDSGLGFAAAEALARQGATVLLAGHSAAKCASAAQNLSALTGADVRGSSLDLSSFANVRTFAQQFLKNFSGKLHYLINDAGISGGGGFKDGKTEDGFEMVFQVNYLGHFLLTELLLPALRNNSPSRVVNVASEEHKLACFEMGLCWKIDPFPRCAKDFTYLPPPVMTKPNTSLYGFSKLMLIEHAAELTSREAASGVTAFSLCPGLVQTDMTKAVPDFIKKTCENPLFTQKPCPYNSEQGAAVIAYTALGSAKPGLWYMRREGCSAESVRTSGFTEAMRPELYKRSRQWVGLDTRSSDEEEVVGKVLV